MAFGQLLHVLAVLYVYLKYVIQNNHIVYGYIFCGGKNCATEKTI